METFEDSDVCHDIFEDNELGRHTQSRCSKEVLWQTETGRWGSVLRLKWWGGPGQWQQNEAEQATYRLVRACEHREEQSPEGKEPAEMRKMGGGIVEEEQLPSLDFLSYCQ